jgi:hypothetical protein
MTKRKRSNKSKYKHVSTGDHCTCAAYVAEIMCMRYAEFKNQGSLPFKFWNKKPWDWTFKKQLWAAQKLIKKFSEQAVVKAIHSDEFKGIFSLNNPKVSFILKKYQIIVDQEQNKFQKLEVKENNSSRKKTFGKNLLNKMRGIDGEKE